MSDDREYRGNEPAERTDCHSRHPGRGSGSSAGAPSRRLVPCDGGPLLRAMYLATLVWPTSIPILSSSPWIRGAPHNGFAMLISRINWRISSDTAGRPGRRLDFQRQYDRKPARCQRITVSGRMMASAPRVFGNNPQTQPRTNRSLAENANWPTLPRRSTMICCRSTRISASSVARDRNRSKTRQKISLMRPNIRASVTRFCAPRQPDPIYDSDNPPACGINPLV
jgi:hypothetical protein